MFKPLVIVGPSGAGKGTLIDLLKYSIKKDELCTEFGFSVSYTTRAPREKEVYGKDYFFITVEEFKAKISNDEFIEYCEVHSIFYGTSKS